MPPVHLALVDDSPHEVPGVRYHPPASLRCRAWTSAPATTTPRPRSRRGCRTTPPAAILVLREQIILAYLGLADRLASRYRHSRGTTPEDLIQTARAGLIAAIDRYDPGYGSPFVPYAVACVVGELKRYLRDTSWRLHVPRPLKERALRLCRAADELHQRLGRSPTTRELAEQLEVGEEEVLEALAAVSSRQEVSLDQPVGDDRPCLGDLVAAPGAGEEPEDLLALPGLVSACRNWSARSLSCGSSMTWTRTRSRPGSASPRCMSPGCSAGPWPACALSWCNRDRAKEVAMQVMWMVMVTLALAVAGIVGLAVVTHVTAWARRR